MFRYSVCAFALLFISVTQVHLWAHGSCAGAGPKKDCSILHHAPAHNHDGEQCQCDQTTPETCPETLFQVLHAHTGLHAPVRVGFIQSSACAAENGFGRSQFISPHLNALSSVILLI